VKTLAAAMFAALAACAPRPVSVSGTLGPPAAPCPEALPAVEFVGADGRSFGAAVICGDGEPLGFAATLDPGVYEARIELPDGRVAVARGLAIRTDVRDLPLGVIDPGD